MLLADPAPIIFIITGSVIGFAAIPAMLLAAAGVRVCHRLPSSHLRIAVSLVMVVIGLQMTGIFSAFGALIFP